MSFLMVMAPKTNRTKPLIWSLGESGVIEAVLADMVCREQIAADAARPRRLARLRPI
jgi:hypothetical protein